jgi:hypothetical protein
VAQAELDIGIALDHAAEHQRRAGHGGLEQAHLTAATNDARE